VAAVVVAVAVAVAVAAAVVAATVVTASRNRQNSHSMGSQSACAFG
jgi:hypothetical protein